MLYDLEKSNFHKYIIKETIKLMNEKGYTFKKAAYMTVKKHKREFAYMIHHDDSETDDSDYTNSDRSDAVDSDYSDNDESVAVDSEIDDNYDD